MEEDLKTQPSWEKELEEIKKERDEYINGWKRAKADFLNYKKDEESRMQTMAEYAERELLIKILPIFDSLSRAEKEISQDQREDLVYKGFLQIVSQWREFLKAEGIEEVQTLGKPFNPEVHEAVGEVDPPAGEEPGMVVEEVEKGYIMNDKLLRPAKVKIIK